MKFGEIGDRAVQELLWDSVVLHPEYNIPQHVQQLHQSGVALTRSFVGAIF